MDTVWFEFVDKNLSLAAYNMYYELAAAQSNN